MEEEELTDEEKRALNPSDIAVGSVEDEEV